MVKFFIGYKNPNKEDISVNFEEKLPKVIDYFVETHGEKIRKHYTEAFNNSTYIFVDKINVDNNKFFNLYKEKLLENLKDELNLPQFEETSFSYDNLFWITEIPCLNSIKNSDSYRYESTLQYLYNFLKFNEQFETFEEFLHSPDLDSIIYKVQNDIRPLYLMIKCFYFSDKYHFESYSQLEKTYNINLCNYFKNYFANFNFDLTDENINAITYFINYDEDLISDEDKQILCDIFKDIFKKYNFEKLGKNISAKQNIENLNFNEIMDICNLPEFKKTANKNLEIIEKTFYESLYEMYPEVKQQLTKIAEYLISISDDEQEIIKTINHIFNFCFNRTADSACVARVDGASLCILQQDSENEMVVHELEHLGSSYFGCEDYTFKCGLRYYVMENGKEHSYGGTLNEAVNQSFALKIDDNMRKDNFLIGSDKHYECAYNCMSGLVLEFLNSFKQFITAFNSDNMLELFDSVGYENYIQLEKCFKRIYKITNCYTAEEIDQTINYWQRIIHPETFHPFVKDIQTVKVEAFVKMPSNDILNELKTLKKIYDDIVAYQKNAGVGV